MVDDVYVSGAEWLYKALGTLARGFVPLARAKRLLLCVALTRAIVYLSTIEWIGCTLAGEATFNIALAGGL